MPNDIVLSMRIDERKVPSAVLKKFCMKEEERARKEKQVPKLSRGHRLDIKESVKLMLTKKAVPIPAVARAPALQCVMTLEPFFSSAAPRVAMRALKPRSSS